MTGSILHPIVRAGLARWKTLVRVVCVLAIAVASVSHVVADSSSVQSGPLSVMAASADGDGSSGTSGTVERCHTCAVVAFMVAVQSGGREVPGGLIPESRLLPLTSVQLPATAPPPRTLN